MDIELIETLKLIIDRYEGRLHGSVFIPLRDFPWYNESNGQLKQLHEAGMITEPRYSDNGAVITLTTNGRHFFDVQEGGVTLTKEKIYEILSALSKEMNIPAGNFGFEPGPCRSAIKQLQDQGYIQGVFFF